MVTIPEAADVCTGELEVQCVPSLSWMWGWETRLAAAFFFFFFQTVVSLQPSKTWKVSQKTLVLQVWIQPLEVTQNVEFGEHSRSQYQEGRHRRTPGDHWLTLQNQGVPLTYPVSENKVDDREMTPKVDFWSPWAWTFVPMGERTCACSCVHAHTHKHYAWMSTHIQEQTSEESWVVCTWRRFLRQDPLTQGRDKLKMRSRTIFHLPSK